MNLLDGTRVTTLLCDADGNLFPSEEPAFDASVVVTNAFLAEHGVDEQLDAHALRLATTGKNFRTTVQDLAAAHRISLPAEALEHWVRAERDAVTRHLGQVLAPDPAVHGPLTRLAERYRLAAVSSSATVRLAACFDATDLTALIPPERRFSAEDSLARPTSKPDPAIYLHACRSLGISAEEAVAVEDSVPGAQSAVAAGIRTVGNVQFVPDGEREARIAELQAAGVCAVVSSWAEVDGLLSEARQLVNEAT